MTSPVIQTHDVAAVRRYFDALVDGDVGRVLCSLNDRIVLEISTSMNHALEGTFQQPNECQATRRLRRARSGPTSNGRVEIPLRYRDLGALDPGKSRQPSDRDWPPQGLESPSGAVAKGRLGSDDAVQARPNRAPPDLRAVRALRAALSRGVISR